MFHGGEAPWGAFRPRNTERLLWTPIAIEGFNDLTPQLGRFLQMSKPSGLVVKNCQININRVFPILCAASLVWSFQKSSFKESGTLHLSFIVLKLYLKPAQKKPLLVVELEELSNICRACRCLCCRLCENDRINYSLGVTG